MRVAMAQISSTDDPTANLETVRAATADAASRGAELVVVNRGRTAVDEIAGLRIEGGTSEVLGAAADALLAG